MITHKVSFIINIGAVFIEPVYVSWGKKVNNMVGVKGSSLEAKSYCRTCSLTMATEG